MRSPSPTSAYFPSGTARFSVMPFLPSTRSCLFSGGPLHDELRRVVPPLADVVVGRRLPGGVVDLAPAPAELELEARRRARVEREHPVVGVAAERLHDADAALERAIEGHADLVHRACLDHEMVQALL